MNRKRILYILGGVFAFGTIFAFICIVAGFDRGAWAGGFLMTTAAVSAFISEMAHDLLR